MTPLAGMGTGGLAYEGREILRRYRRVAIVGLSPDPSRPSYRAAVHLLAYGYDVFPVNPRVDEVLGQRAYPSLADVPQPVEIVDVFRRPEAISGVTDEAIAVGARVLWLQLGLRDEASAERARAAGLEVIQDRCIKMEHCRWFGGLNWVGLATGVVSSRREEADDAA